MSCAHSRRTRRRCKAFRADNLGARLCNHGYTASRSCTLAAVTVAAISSPIVSTTRLRRQRCTAVVHLVGDFLHAGLGALRHDIVQDCDMLRFQPGGLPPTLIDGSVPSSGSLVAMACSFHIGITRHSYVVDLSTPS